MLNLHDIKIDIMDYIRKAHCTDEQFRTMWAEFEWENKVSVTTNIADLRDYLTHIQNITNTACLTLPKALEGDCNFLTANLYARSIFGEDALVNVSVEKVARGNGGKRIIGAIRIRSKTQGIALSLGDRITALQRDLPEEK